MRQLLAEKKLDQLLFDTVTKKLASAFSVGAGKQRLDSVHITSNMRRLGRIGIFVRVICILWHTFLHCDGSRPLCRTTGSGGFSRGKGYR
jgi:hypothetical protein